MYICIYIKVTCVNEESAKTSANSYCETFSRIYINLQTTIYRYTSVSIEP